MDWNTRDNDPGCDSDSFSFRYLDWKLGVEKDLAQDMMAYFTLASGHKPGGYSEDDCTPFDVESDVSGELGLKSRFLDNRLQLNGDVFYYLYKGYQVVDAYFWINPLTNEQEMLVKFFNSDSKVLNLGAEIDVTALIGNATEFDFNFSYLKNKYTEDFILHADPMYETGVNYERRSHAPFS